MLPLGSRVAGVNQIRKESRRHWRLLFAILECNDSVHLPRRFTTSSRNRYSGSGWKIPYHKSEPNVFPESLQDTLEAHRDANRVPQIDQVRVRRPRSNPDLKAADVSKGRTKDAKKQRWKRVKQFGRTYLTPSGLINYQGHDQFPKDEWTLSPRAVAGDGRGLWLAHLDEFSKRSEHVYDCLTAQIIAFGKYMEPTASEKAAVEKVVSDVQTTIQSISPTIKVSTIGSRSTGLAMPLSDIDINIEHSKPVPGEKPVEKPVEKRNKRRGKRRGKRFEPEGDAINLLRTVARALKKRGGPKPAFKDTILIERAKVPIVETQHVSTRLQIQVQCTVDGKVSMEVVKAYLDNFPTLRPLFLVLRQVLKMRNLAEPRSYGIGSYPLIMMIVAILKFSSSRFEITDAGRQLIYFLDFYSKMDYENTGIAVEPPALFPKWSKKGGLLNQADHVRSFTPDKEGNIHADEIAGLKTSSDRKKIGIVKAHRPYLMCLQDPVDEDNDLGYQAAAIKHVKATFSRLAEMMQTSMHLFEASNNKASFSLLDPCLAGNYERFEDKRKKLQRVGESLMPKPEVAKHL